MSRRLAFVVPLTLCACGDAGKPLPRRSSLETQIARELTAKLAAPVSATCTELGSLAKCEAMLFDGTKLPIDVKSERDAWEWHVAGVVVETPPIASHVIATLADLKLSRAVNCGARIQVVQPGERISCMLSGGGMAFVRIAGDGSTSIELALDKASAAARMELVTPERDRELTKISVDLEKLEGESDGEEEVPADGGVPAP